MTSQALQQKDERSRRFGGVLSKYVHYSEGKNAVVLFDLLDAIKDFSADFPNDPHCLELQSVLACDGKNWVAARTYLTAAASLGSQNLNVHRDLSYVNLRLRDFSEVRRHCLHCIERDGTSINDYYGLAAALYALDRVKEAIPVLDKALRDHPDLPLNKDPDFLKRQTRAQARSLPSIMLNTLFKSASMYIVTRLARGLNIPRCISAATASMGPTGPCPAMN